MCKHHFSYKYTYKLTEKSYAGPKLLTTTVYIKVDSISHFSIVFIFILRNEDLKYTKKGIINKNRKCCIESRKFMQNNDFICYILYMLNKILFIVNNNNNNNNAICIKIVKFQYFARHLFAINVLI